MIMQRVKMQHLPNSNNRKSNFFWLYKNPSWWV